MRCLAVLLVLLLGGCAGSGVSADSTSGAFPARTAQDWVTYGDFFIELEAVSEQTLPPDENERFAGEGMFRREFTLTIEKVWWRRPGVKHRPPTQQQQWVSGGWEFRNGNLDRRTRITDPNQLQVGQRYLAMFSYDGRSLAKAWNGWWSFGRLPLSDGTLGRRVEGRRDSGSQPIYRALEGRTPAEAAELLRRTRPDPDVVPFLHENPQDRYQHGAGAKRSRGTPTPRER